jgi:outer membrane protein TolC
LVRRLVAVGLGLLAWSVPTAARGRGVDQDSTVFPLLEAVRRALATHPSVAITEAEMEGAAAQVAEARSALLPRLAVDVGGTRHEEPMIVAPLHGFDPQRPPRFDPLLLQGRLTAGWMLFDGGARRARIDRARANEGSASAGDEAARSALVERVVRAYLRVRGGRELEGAHRAQVGSLEAERDRAERMLAAGRVARVNVLRAEAALSRARASEATAAAALREAEAELARLTGQEVEALAGRRIEAAAPAAGLGEPDRTVLVERAVAASPTVERARRRQGAAEAGHREAAAAFWPTLSLAAGYNAFASAADAAVTEWQAALQLAWPLFTGGSRKAASERTAAEVVMATEAVRLATLDVASEVDRWVTALEEAAARVGSLEAAAAQFEEVLQVETLALQAGAGVQSDYLRAVSDLLETRAALTEARSAVVGAHVSLARLTGELGVGWLERMVEVRQ